MQKYPSSKKASTATALIAASLILSVIAILMTLLLGSWKPVSLTRLPDPKGTVQSCLELIGQGRYGECDAYLADFSVADMESEPKTEQGRLMMELLSESYSWRMDSESEISGMMAFQPVEVTYLDLARFGDSVKEQANLLAEELNFQGIDIFTEEAAMEIADQAIDKLRENIEDYYITELITIELEYDGGEWKILYSEQLGQLIMGGSL